MDAERLEIGNRVARARLANEWVLNRATADGNESAVSLAKDVLALCDGVERLRGVAEVALAQVGTTCRRPTNITDTRGRVGHPCGEPAKCLPCALAALEAALAELEGKG